MATNSDFAWYVLRVTYGREMALKEHLDAKGFETFVPMHYKERCRQGVVTRRLESVVRNLLFVYTMRSLLDELKPEMEFKYPFRYFIDRTTRKAIIIPELQMRHFIAVTRTSGEQHIFLDAVDSTLTKGDRVRVVFGPFAGIEGVFVRLKGDRRVVITLQGLMSVATAFIHPSMVEKID